MVNSTWGATPDVNGDGRPDVIVAAPGAAVAAAGDVDGDGYGDVVFGAPRESGGDGAAYLFRGAAAAPYGVSERILRDSSNTAQGTSVAGLGDVNGDGFSDFAISAPQRGGRVSVFMGRPRGTALPRVDLVTGTSQFGQAVAGVGDINGDGYSDLLVGAPQEASSAGRVFVYLSSATGVGTTASATLSPPAGSPRRFGYGLAVPGDLWGAEGRPDGRADFLVGAIGLTSPTPADTDGRAFVYLGGSPPLGAPTPLSLMFTPAAEFGYDFAG